MAKKPQGIISIWGNKCPVCSFVTSQKTCPRCDTALTPDAKTLVFKDTNLQSGFAQIPNKVLRDPRLGATAVRLYCLLLSYAWEKESCFPGQDTLAGEMGCNRATVFRALQELGKFRLVTSVRQGLGKTNIYYIEKLSDGYLT